MAEPLAALLLALWAPLWRWPAPLVALDPAAAARQAHLAHLAHLAQLVRELMPQPPEAP